MSSLTRLNSRVWDGAVGLVIQSDHLQIPLTVSRNSYLAVLYPLIDLFFATFSSADAKSSKKIPLWLESNGEVIHWNIPAGVLYDSLHVTSLKTSVWTLTIHYGECPDLGVIPFIYRDKFDRIDYSRLINESVVNELKQSCFVLNGLARPMMNLSEPDSRLMWTSIVNLDRTEYTRVSSKVLLNTRRYPIKVLGPNSDHMVLAPMPLRNENSSAATLGDVFEKFDVDPESIAIIQGVCMSKDMYLDALWHAFKHLDNFLYVVLKPPVKKALNICGGDMSGELHREAHEDPRCS